MFVALISYLILFSNLDKLLRLVDIKFPAELDVDEEPPEYPVDYGELASDELVVEDYYEMNEEGEPLNSDSDDTDCNEDPEVDELYE